MTISEPSVVELLEARLSDRIPELLGDVRDTLAEGWPDYAEFLATDIEDVQAGAGLFVHRLLLLATRAPGTPARLLGEPGLQPLFEQIGRQQWQTGHDLTRLLTAYQLGARVAWRHVSDTAAELNVSREVLGALAEAVFDFVSYLSQSSAHGYVSAQREDSRERDRHRQELAALLVSERSSMPAIQAEARLARWPLPSTAAIVLLSEEDGDLRRLLSQLDSYALPIRHDDLVGAILPDPSDARRDSLTQSLAGLGAVVGIGAPVEWLPRTVEVARIARDLRARGVLADDPVFVTDHLDTVVVHRDDRLLSFLQLQFLAPLDGLSPGARSRLTETLRSWLLHQGDRTAVAADLKVHPQTVSYRVNRLRELFEDRLDSPRERLRLLLAVGWSRPN